MSVFLHRLSRPALGALVAALHLLASACSSGSDNTPGDETAGAEAIFGPKTTAPGSLIRPSWAVARPNIILIVTDDQDIPSLTDMPSVQRHLIKNGMTFSHAYAPTPLCCPARASIFRGQYSHNHGVKVSAPSAGGFSSFFNSKGESSTIATWLDAAGYTTFFAGKYMNGYTGIVRSLPQTYVPPGWDRWFGDLAPQGYFNYRVNDNGTVREYGDQPEDYLTDVLAAKAVEFIRSAAAEDAPFFILVAPFAPHDSPPLQRPVPARRHAGTFAGREAPRGPSFNEPDVGDKPWLRSQPLLTDEAVAAIDEHHRARLQTMLAVDEMVETLFATLAASGEVDETYVFYTTDNGYHLGQHRLAKGKGMPYEEDIIVPLVVAGPGISAGSRDHLVLLSDLAPTIAHLAGVQVPLFVDSRSLLPLLSDEPIALGQWRQAFVIAYWQPKNDEVEYLRWRGLRTRTHKYIEWGPDHSQVELYDLASDPFELESQHRTADPELVSGLATWLDALFECAAETCRGLENAPPGLDSGVR